MNQPIDMTGKKIGWWSVIERTDPPAHVKSTLKQAWWLCKCKCGTQKPRTGGQLREGKTKSCGCSRRCNKINSKQANIKTRFPSHHNLKNTFFYRAWYRLISTCYQKNYLYFKNYGAKGISVCDEWRRVEGFISWAKERWKKGYSLELKDGATVFSPDTVFWIPKGDKISRIKKQNRKAEYRNLIGQKFGALTVTEETMITLNNGRRESRLKCICRCQKTSLVQLHSLITGKTKKCACSKVFKWSLFFEKCINCGKSDSRHAAKGVCFRCYHRNRSVDLKHKGKND